MKNLGLDDFSGSLGEEWRMEAGDQAWPAELIDASPLAESGREGGSFRLEFRGPADPVLPQGTYTFRRDETAHDIFVCPIGRDQAGTRYEAIFY
jgi:hypothetical protein